MTWGRPGSAVCLAGFDHVKASTCCGCALLALRTSGLSSVKGMWGASLWKLGALSAASDDWSPCGSMFCLQTDALLEEGWQLSPVGVSVRIAQCG